MRSKQQILRGMVWLFLGQIWSWSLRLVEAAIIPRILGDTGIGMVSYAGTVFTLIGLVVMFGGPEHIIRSLAADRERGARVATALLLVRAIALVPLLLILYCVFRFAIHPDPTILGLVTINVFTFYITQVTDVLTAWRQGYSQFPVVARTQMIAQSIGLPAKIVMVRGGVGPRGVAYGDLLANIAGFISLALHKHNPVRFVRVKRADIVRMIREGLPFSRYGFCLWLYGDPTSILYITWITHSYRAVGWFALSQKLAGVLFFVPVTIMSALMPTMTDRFERAREEYQALATRFVNLVLALSVPFSLTLIVRCDKLLEVLYPKFDHAKMTILLELIGVELWVRWASVCYGALLVVTDRAAKRADAAMVAAPYNLIATPLMVFLFDRWMRNGALGAIVAAETTEVIVVGIYLRCFRGTGMVRANLSTMGRAVLAGVVPFLILRLPIHSLAGFLIVGSLAVLAYVPAAVLTGALPKSDLALLRQVVRSKGR